MEFTKIKQANINGKIKDVYIKKAKIFYKNKKGQYKKITIDSDTFKHVFVNSENIPVFELESTNNKHKIIVNTQIQIEVKEIVKTVNDFLFFNKKQYKVKEYKDNDPNIPTYDFKVPVVENNMVITAVQIEEGNIYSVEINQNNYIYNKIKNLLYKNKSSIHRNGFKITLNKENNNIELVYNGAINTNNKKCKNITLIKQNTQILTVEWKNKYKANIQEENQKFVLKYIKTEEVKKQEKTFLQKAASILQ